MKSLLKRYIGANDGQFGLTFAILSLPLILSIGVALDTALLYKKAEGLQRALDNAALAAVVSGNMSIDERKKRAEVVFNQNFISPEDVTLDIQASDTRVDVKAKLVKNTILMGLSGQDSVNVVETAAAIRTVEDTICIMTLDESKKGSLTFESSAFVNAPGCSIQVNSDSPQAIVSTSSLTPIAKSICSAGGSSGNLPKDVKGECTVVDDPYAHISVPKPTKCDYGPMSFFNWQDNAIIGQHNIEMKPGTYCGGLNFYDSTVTLAPGTYVMYDGPLTIGHNSYVKGEGVTFVLQGEGSVLYTYEDFKLELEAPKTGPYAGLLFLQDRNSSVDDTSIIKGGADINLVGTMYFPTQNLFVGGVGTMGASSPAMAFIAKNMTFTSKIDRVVSAGEENILALKQFIELAVSFINSVDEGILNYTPTLTTTGGKGTKFETSILTNSREAGLPPILPRSDAGARLLPKG